MKKKAALIIAVIVVCSVLGVIANNYQKKLATKEVEKEKITVAEDNSKENAKQISESSSYQTQNDTSASKKQDDKTSENKISSSSSTSTATQKPQNSTTNNSTDNKAVTTNPAPTPIKQPDNFFVIDSVNNKVIYSSREDFAGKTADKLTIDVLNRQKINKVVITSLAGTYFSSIADLAERSAGEKSGWCYFINGEKFSKSSSSYTLKSDDKIEWKFMQDGI